MTLPQSYFEDMYHRSADPWGFQDRWYEQRKRQITMASLPDRQYQRCFEAGCSIGLVTTGLADRCNSLLAVDASEAAVRQAARAVDGFPHVRVEQRMLPEQWPVGERFDLVVLSEVGYYFDTSDLSALLDLAVGSLAPAGVLLACHWRHPVADYPLPGDAVHETIARRPELVRSVRHEEADFLLEVFTLGAQPTVAQQEGLIR
jgi:SAM-dependent methyltransferase